MVFYTLHTFIIRGLGEYSAVGFIELVKLLFTAKYSYFLMLSGTMLGIAIGMHIRRLVASAEPLSTYLSVGLVLVLLGGVISSHVGDLNNWLVWPISYNYIWRWIVYAGAILIMLSVIDRLLLSYDNFDRVVQFFVQFFAVIGILAFPLFITHEMVLPLKSILVSFGIGGVIALVIPLCLFLTSSYMMFKKIRGVNFL